MRKKEKPDRYGAAETNYNDFMNDLDATDSANSNATTITTSTPNKETIDSGKCGCTELLKLLLKKTDAIEDHLIKLDVTMKHLNSTPSYTQKVKKLMKVDIVELREFGLPLSSESELENFDQKLKKDIEFRTKLVSYPSKNELYLFWNQF